MKFESIKKDFDNIVDKYGLPEDMTGGFVDGDKFYELLADPTKQRASSIMKSIIDYGFQGGEYYQSENNGKVYINDCPMLNKIYTKYYIDFNY